MRSLRLPRVATLALGPALFLPAVSTLAGPGAVGRAGADVRAAPVAVVLPAEEIVEPIDVGDRLTLLADPGGTTSAVALAEAAFERVSVAVPNFGFTDTVYRARFVLRNEGPGRRVLVQVGYPLLDFVDFSACRLDPPGVRTRSAGEQPHRAPPACSSGAELSMRSGDRLPFPSRIVDQRSFLFPLDLAPGSYRVSFRFESSGTQQFPIRVLTPEALRQSDATENLALGLYYGILIILTLYNLVLFFIVRDPSYLLYLFYISGYGFIQLNLNGLAYRYFWPNSPAWANVSLTFFIGWTFVWATQFSRNFLNTPSRTVALDTTLRALTVSFGLLAGASFVTPYSWNIIAAAILVIAFSALVLVAALRVLSTGYRPARFFLLAWASLLLGVTVFAMKGLGLLPANFATEYGLQIGSAVEMGLLSLGLADRISVMQREQERARRQAAEQEGIRRRAELNAARLEIELLKKNVEPHFLLNSINASMVWLEEDPQSASRLLAALAEELRMLLELTPRSQISMAEELRLCRVHLELMGLRHDRAYELQTEGILDEEPIPPLVLHTIVENGLTHGFRGRGTGRFTIRRRQESPSGPIELVVENDGSSESAPGGSGMGLRYVRTRLEEAFPGRWSLDSGPIQGGWSTRIRLPVQFTPAQH